MKHSLLLSLLLIFSLAVVNGQGNLDTTFAQTGVIHFNLGDNSETIAYAVVASPNLTSYTVMAKVFDGEQSIYVRSHLADGSVNSAFGINGEIELFLPPGSEVENIYVHYTTDNHLIGLASVYNSFVGGMGYMMTKITASGAPVLSFGSNGVVEQMMPGIWIETNGIAVDAQQNIYVYGYRDNDDIQSPVYEYPFVARHLANGQPDANFATNGVFDFGLQFDGMLIDATFNINGDLIVSGIIFDLFDQAFLASINSAGELVASFGTMGFVYITLTTAMLQPVKIYLTTDGFINVVFQGMGLTFLETELVMMQFNAVGWLNTSFGTAGMSTVEIGTDLQFVLSAAALPDNGSIVNCIVLDFDNESIYSRLFKLRADGSLDESFGDEGVFTFDFDGNSNAVLGLYAASEDKLYTSGATLDFNTETMAAFVARLNLKPDVTSTAIPHDGELFDIAVYPNPAVNFINITAKSAQLAAASVQLYDLSGRPVLHREADFSVLSTHTVQIPASLPGGLYWIDVQSAEGARAVKPIHVVR